jgi:hypothetical protein
MSDRSACDWPAPVGGSSSTAARSRIGGAGKMDVLVNNAAAV